ncbi:zinc finger MYM-type protein 1-like [Pyrus ussuriensis x Pyrus communis]|uniref:Zinc finger MYM-type protein 1-like n=1 Tax=Pyrus ussuriensis x Pyrus communis TaxID=2448454 RepID=A0A5N5GXT4_9ROSA|nr:zinc finger MYM-type protein 1-like [Pyrus ussuriensis x Pyrus communis]
MNPSQHVDKVINRQSKEQILKKRLRLKATIECVRWLTFQACPFKGHDELVGSKNRGNFIELVKHTAKFNDKVAAVVLENAPNNAKYSSPMIQKKVLNILTNIVRRKIREEVGDGVFCILVDKAHDTAHREQMAIILRFVDNDDTTAPTLHKEIKKVLAFHELPINKLRGQGYDGVSNMRGQWNGLQSLFIKECSFAYYVHFVIWLFFSALGSIVNVITTSPKLCDLIRDASCTVLENIKNDKSATHSLRGEATGAYNAIRYFEFTFILHLFLFCKKHDVNMPDMNAQYKVGTGRSCQQTDHITFEHHYHIDIFNNVIDFQLAELNSRFSEEAMELLILSSGSEPGETFKAFNIDHICKLAEKFYPLDFTNKELHTFRCELKIYESDVPHHLVFQKMSTTSELCRGLVETKRSKGII